MDKETKETLIIIGVLVGFFLFWFVGYHEAKKDNIVVNWLMNQ